MLYTHWFTTPLPSLIFLITKFVRLLSAVLNFTQLPNRIPCFILWNYHRYWFPVIITWLWLHWSELNNFGLNGLQFNRFLKWRFRINWWCVCASWESLLVAVREWWLSLFVGIGTVRGWIFAFPHVWLYMYLVIYVWWYVLGIHYW